MFAPSKLEGIVNTSTVYTHIDSPGLTRGANDYICRVYDIDKILVCEVNHVALAMLVGILVFLILVTLNDTTSSYVLEKELRQNY